MRQSRISVARRRAFGFALLSSLIAGAVMAAPAEASHAPGVSAWAKVTGSYATLTAYRDGWGALLRVTVKDTAADGDCAYAIVTLAVSTYPDSSYRYDNCRGNGVTLLWDWHRLAAGRAGTGIPQVKLKACRNRSFLPDPCYEYTMTLPQMTAHATAARIALMNDIQALSLARFSRLKAQHPAPYDWSDDGCSIPSGIPGGSTWGARFLVACQRHDWGYRNFGKKFFQPTDARRQQIDTVFYNDMIAICHAHSWTGCGTVALLFRAAVRNFGGRAFFKA
jgi:hypothetical protein